MTFGDPINVDIAIITTIEVNARKQWANCSLSKAILSPEIRAVAGGFSSLCRYLGTLTPRYARRYRPSGSRFQVAKRQTMGDGQWVKNLALHCAFRSSL